MGKWLALAGVALATACNYGAGAFRCTDDNQCGAGGACEIDNLCSLPSSTCASGRVYSDLSGVLSGQCVSGSGPGGEIDASLVDGPPAIDASIDATPIDATACFGTGLVQICLAAPPTQPLMISSATTINTDDTAMCAALTSGGNYCVVAGTTVTVGATLRATGARPLVLLATDTLVVSALVDVGSHRGANPEIGAGANPAACLAGTPPGTSGGGAGGSFTGQGGAGGGPNLGVPGAAVATVTELRGGCAGQDGNGANRGARGNGGGAVFLIAGTSINVTGTINAGGEGGGAGTDNSSGGGGGGTGGMIGLDAPAITSTGLILANGGAGGEGSGANQTGNPGADATTIAAARGGNGRSNNGGDGGNGSAGAASGPGAPGLNGTNSGGGGGGGAGLINAPAAANLGTNRSPAPTP